MTDFKNWHESKGVWGGVVALFAGGAALFGYAVPEADQAQIASLLAAAGGGVGGLLAIAGRLRAQKRIR